MDQNFSALFQTWRGWLCRIQLPTLRKNDRGIFPAQNNVTIREPMRLVKEYNALHFSDVCLARLTMTVHQQEFTLYTYFRSSCSARLRIALNLKDLAYESKFVNLLKNEQSAHGYHEINPSHLVPTLRISTSADDVVITQSLAALEYLDEKYPDTHPLLPKDAASRAQARALANIIACDTQPVTNLRILSRISSLGASKEKWAKNLITEGLMAYDKLAENSAATYSVGDDVTVADICLVPAVWGALRFGVDISSLKTVQRVYDAMSKLDAVQKAHWQNQPDTPEELRPTTH